ncbi:MAG: hypothetical protein QF408_12160 [Pirellulales bacterium]|jgi:hypothetical protein|nr:hypothetical protein [Pirellulales bacterium]HJN66071.1 hypothetical protein [Pirellulales bacterium]
MNLTTIRGLFAVAALYDGLLGVLFVIAPSWVFTKYGIDPPNHLGYVQFSAALLIIFGLMFLNIARDPHKHAPLILYGILLKVAYCSVTLTYWIDANIPWIWKPFTIIDLVMLGLFVWAWKSLRVERQVEKGA